MRLNDIVLGWFLIVGIVLYALTLTAIHASRTVVDILTSFARRKIATTFNP